MDGPSISGGAGGIEIAAGYVSINADMSGLRAAEQETKDIVARIGGMSANLNIGGAGGSIANPTNGASGGGFVLSLKIDENALRTQLETFQRTIAPIRVPVEYVASGSASLPNELPAAAASPMQRMSRRGNSEADQILGAMERNLADAAARGDTAGVARFQSIIASFGGAPATVASPATVAVNPWTTATFPFDQQMIGASNNWTTATGMQGPQYNPWTTATFQTTGRPQWLVATMASQNPWTTATGIRTPNQITQFDPVEHAGMSPLPFGIVGDDEIEEEAEELYGASRRRRAPYVSLQRRASGATYSGRISRNPFSAYGIGRMMGSIAGTYAAFELARGTMDVVGGLAEAARIENQPQLNLRGFYNGETPADIFDDPQILAQSQNLASRQAQLRRIRGFESVPLVGSVIQFEGALSGLPESYSLRAQQAQDAISTQVKYAQLAQATSVESLQFQGNNAGAIRLRSQQQLESRLAEIRQKGGTIAEQDVEGDAATKALALQQEEAKRAGRIYNAQFGDIAALQIRSFSARTLATRAPGSIAEAERLRFQAEQEEDIFQRDEAIANARNPRERIHAEQQGNIRLNTDIANQQTEHANRVRQEESEVGNIRAQGDAAMLRARGDAFSAELRLYQQHAADIRNATAGLSADQLRIVEDGLKKEQQAILESQTRETVTAFGRAGTAFAGSQIEVQASRLRMQGNLHGAEMLGFDRREQELEQQRREADMLPWYQRLPARLRIFGESLVNQQGRQEAEFENQRNVAEEQFGFSSRFQAAEFALKDEPIAQRATNAVARARLEYEQLTRQTNDPKRLLEARRAIEEELRAQRHEIAEQRSGDEALTMGIGEAHRIPASIALNRHMEDIRAATAVFNGGIASIRGGEAIPGTPAKPGGLGMDMAQVMSDAKQLMQKFSDAINKLANAKGVAMFGG